MHVINTTGRSLRGIFYQCTLGVGVSADAPADMLPALLITHKKLHHLEPAWMYGDVFDVPSLSDIDPPLVDGPGRMLRAGTIPDFGCAARHPQKQPAAVDIAE